MAASPACRGVPRLAKAVLRQTEHPCLRTSARHRPRAVQASNRRRTVEMTEGHQQRPLPAAVDSQERPVVPTSAIWRTSRLAMLPLRHAARTAAAASRLSRAATDQVAARTAEQVFATLGELKGGAAKLGQAMSVFEAALPEEAAAPYRSALRRLTDAAPAMPAEVARRVVAADLAAAYGPGWQERLVAFNDIPAAAAAMGQGHRGEWGVGGGPGGGPCAALRPSPGPAVGAGDGPADQAQRVRDGGRAGCAHRRGAGLRA